MGSTYCFLRLHAHQRDVAHTLSFIEFVSSPVFYAARYSGPWSAARYHGHRMGICEVMSQDGSILLLTHRKLKQDKGRGNAFCRKAKSLVECCLSCRYTNSTELPSLPCLRESLSPSLYALFLPRLLNPLLARIQRSLSFRFLGHLLICLRI